MSEEKLREGAVNTRLGREVGEEQAGAVRVCKAVALTNAHLGLRQRCWLDESALALEAVPPEEAERNGARAVAWSCERGTLGSGSRFCSRSQGRHHVVSFPLTGRSDEVARLLPGAVGPGAVLRGMVLQEVDHQIARAAAWSCKRSTLGREGSLCSRSQGRHQLVSFPLTGMSYEVARLLPGAEGPGAVLRWGLCCTRWMCSGRFERAIVWGARTDRAICEMEMELQMAADLVDAWTSAELCQSDVG